MRVFTVAMFCMAVFATAQVTVELGNMLASPQQIMQHFEAHQEPAAQAILRLGIASKTPIGLVLTASGPCKAKVELTSDRQPVGSILDQLVSQVEAYNWSVRNGVALIVPKATPPNSARILDAVVPRYANTATSMYASAQYLWALVRNVFHPGEGFILDTLSSDADAQVPAIEMRNATAEQILDQIVVKTGGGAWVLLPQPADNNNRFSEQPIWAFGYNDKYVEDAVRKVCSMAAPQNPQGTGKKQ